MREKNRNSIESNSKLPQFTTMNVIDGQAGLVIYSSLIFYSLTIDNILNIIVLLILAGVTIVTLTGDNGLLEKATSAKEKNEESEICEQIKLAYGEYQVAKYDNTNKTPEKIIEDSLKKIYGENITKVKVKDEKITVNMLVDTQPKTYIYKANTGETFEYIDVINYNGKTKNTLVAGDDIYIGTEQFKVFSVSNREIKAIPYYNLVRVASDETVKQGPAVEGISTALLGTFSTKTYWSKDEKGNIIDGWNSEAVNNAGDIDMNNPSNNFQPYINAYKTTLEKMGVEDIEVRAGRYSELLGSTTDLRNPGQSGDFWLGSFNPDSFGNVWSVDNEGKFIYGGTYGYTCSHGTRPIIIISI